ncbi:hypothetical protein GC194_01550 [bacterium]|nr:hypothetical protein [bacterium]
MRHLQLMFIQNHIPTPWGKGSSANIRYDLSAGLSVALVALPLCLGKALASGVPLSSGIVAVVVSGLLFSLFSGSQVAVKGPAAGLIVVTLGAMEYFDTGNIIETFKLVLPIYICAGAVLLLLGIFKMGKLADFFPTSVVRGMLAAIGVIIFAKQLDIGFLGEKSPFKHTLEIISNLGYYISHINPVVTIITVNSLVIMLLLPRLKLRILKILPPPVWVMLLSVPMVFMFNLTQNRELHMLGRSIHLGPDLLINLPENIIADVIFPDFSQIGNPMFWFFVLLVGLVSVIEHLASAKAVESLDPYKRKAGMNRELICSGLATMVSGLVGGLPVIAVIAPSTVNINQGARTVWASFYQGLFVFAFVFFFGRYIEFVPLAALSAILIHTSFKLVSPKVFKDSYLRGGEQFIILLGTMFAILSYGLVSGIALGIGLTLLIHSLKSGMSVKLFFRYLLRPGIRVIHENEDIIIKLKGIANFFNILKIKKLIEAVPGGKHILLEFSSARLVDHTVLEYAHKHSKEYNRLGGNMELVGLDVHTTSSTHPFSLHVNLPKKRRLSRRQQHLQLYAQENNWQFQPELNWHTTQFDRYNFFAARPVEFEKNIITGTYQNLGLTWRISDITFDEGALVAKEVFHTTVHLIELPFELPTFSLEKEHFTDKVLALAGFNDIDFDRNDLFSKSFLLHGDNKPAIESWFTEELRDFFLNHEIYHLESAGKSLMLFQYFRLASVENIKKMVDFGDELMGVLHKIHLAQAN